MTSKHNVLNARNKKRDKKSALQRRRKHRENLICPTHNLPMKMCHTQFGDRWNCSVKGCDVSCWSGHTSTPADIRTRKLRNQCHDVFDPLWKNGGWSRETAYSKLAEFMQVSQKDCHIGYFNAEQCERATQWALQQRDNHNTKGK